MKRKNLEIVDSKPIPSWLKLNILNIRHGVSLMRAKFTLNRRNRFVLNSFLLLIFERL